MRVGARSWWLVVWCEFRGRGPWSVCVISAYVWLCHFSLDAATKNLAFKMTVKADISPTQAGPQWSKALAQILGVPEDDSAVAISNVSGDDAGRTFTVNAVVKGLGAVNAQMLADILSDDTFAKTVATAAAEDNSLQGEIQSVEEPVVSDQGTSDSLPHRETVCQWGVSWGLSSWAM